MTNPQNDDLGLLGYTSSAPDFDFAPKETVKPQDEADLSTLEKVSRLFAAYKAQDESIHSLALGDITLENQLIINRRMLQRTQELESLVNGTINKVREKQSGRE